MVVDLALWSALERRYDGAIPADEWRRLYWDLDSSDEHSRLLNLRALYAAAVRSQIRRMRKARQIACGAARVQVLHQEMRHFLRAYRLANQRCQRHRYKEMHPLGAPKSGISEKCCVVTRNQLRN